MQFIGLASVVTVVGFAGVSAAHTLRGNKATEVTTSGGTVTVPDSRPATPTAATPPVVLQSLPVATPAETVPVAAPARPASRGGFVLVEGRTKLADSIYAVRTGDSVIVNFDAFGFRTRRSGKLESTLRLTMPMVFGKMATASLDTLKEGQLVTNRDVVGTLAAVGMPLTLDNGATVRIRPLTRVGRDGPLAVGYLVVIER